MEKYSFMKMKKHHAIIKNGKVVTNEIPITMTGEPQVIYFDASRQHIGNNKLALKTDLTLESTSSEIKAAVHKYLALHYKLFSMVRYAKLTPLKKGTSF